MANRAGNDDRNFGAGANGATNDANDLGESSNPGSSGSNGGRKSARGFASMDTSKQKEIASKGGRAAHAKGTAHEFDAGEARAAGRKGGMAVSRNREHMAMIGRRGGEARGQRARANAQTAGTSGIRSTIDASRQNTTGQGIGGNTRGIGEREVGISGSVGATQNSRAAENGLGGERRQSSPAGGVEGTRGEDRA
jgi:general stress protein YciG